MTTRDSALRDKYRVNHKVRCAMMNKCRRCPRKNDNPTSMICKRCTQRSRLYQRRRIAKMRACTPDKYERLREQWREAQRAYRRAA